MLDIHYNGAFMPLFRIHRMKDNPRQQFRWAPHVSGAAIVKPKDYEPAGEIEAGNEYEAWARLRASDTPLLLGDLLEIAAPDSTAGPLRICKYVGFEEARWFVPEPAGEPASGGVSPDPVSALQSIEA